MQHGGDPAQTFGHRAIERGAFGTQQALDELAHETLKPDDFFASRRQTSLQVKALGDVGHRRDEIARFPFADDAEANLERNRFAVLADAGRRLFDGQGRVALGLEPADRGSNRTGGFWQQPFHRLVEKLPRGISEDRAGPAVGGEDRAALAEHQDAVRHVFDGAAEDARDRVESWLRPGLNRGGNRAGETLRQCARGQPAG